MWQYSYREVGMLVQRELQTYVNLVIGILRDTHIDLVQI